MKHVAKTKTIIPGIWLLSCLLHASCSPNSSESATSAPPVPAATTKSAVATITSDTSPRIVEVTAKFSLSSADIPRSNASSAIYRIDKFDVIRVVHGPLNARNITINPFSPQSPGYKTLKEGAVYTITIALSDAALQQLNENRKTQSDNLVINGNDITAMKANP